ncbi:cytochrome c [Pseudobacteriovorax antillogorgiicola]|uniref:Cytochrome c domain-containing protein n=1 Tax=Pseudobacteriovorax antillogorgiicola TaxID=1513793 RepID=A0A1Y6BMA3_9BACT|nr:cytochrome c [Pseudobacteriovorax antillogorgiicola]TCS54649.1 hypothetical protein EDD56_106162 [Pseudobacteriovorax antillogorgiicola]SMF16919.1 hypothetical protein SAMN06296036_10681 [Pseudobacteriovorax antillogorgiicola]
MKAVVSGLLLTMLLPACYRDPLPQKPRSQVSLDASESDSPNIAQPGSGLALYQSQCQSCHEALEESELTGKQLDDIANAGALVFHIGVKPWPQGSEAERLVAVLNLSEAVDESRGSATDGVAYYSTHCQTCHQPIENSTLRSPDPLRIAGVIEYEIHQRVGTWPNVEEIYNIVAALKTYQNPD